VRYDAVVVGGGPAGASCAKVLAEKGLKVLLLEKKKLPRFKLCAGCLSKRIETLLPKGWEKEVLNVIRGGMLGFRGREFVERKAGEDIAYIIDRGSFDYFLVKEAVSSGTDLWEGVEFLGFEEGLKVKTSAGEIEADFLIGADGFYTKVGRVLGYKKEKEKFFRSVEFWTEGDLGDRVVIDAGVVGRGYGWIFPKGDKLSVGLALVGRENPLRKLEGYVKSHKLLKDKRIEGVKGWMIPFAEKEEDLHLGRGRVLLLGDAANLVDPLLGEGIYYAVLSGHLAAKSIIENPDDPLREYTSQVRKHILPELIYAGRIAKLAYRFQRAAFSMGKGFALDRFFKLLQGELGYRDLYLRGLPEFFTSLLRFENFSHIIIDKILRRR